MDKDMSSLDGKITEGEWHIYDLVIIGRQLTEYDSKRHVLNACVFEMLKYMDARQEILLEMAQLSDEIDEMVGTDTGRGPTVNAVKREFAEMRREVIRIGWV